MLDLGFYLKNGIAKLELEYDWREGKIHSTDLSACPRRICYEFSDVKPDDRSLPQSLLLMNGHNFQAMIEKILKAGGASLKVETPVFDSEDRKSTCDWLFISKEDSKRHLVDCKTIAGTALSSAYISLPQEAHIVQVSDYYHGLIEKGVELAPKVGVWYFDRSCQRDPELYWFEPLKKDQVDGMYNVLKEHLNTFKDSGALPPKLKRVIKVKDKGESLYLEPDYRCNYCDFAKTCDPDLHKNKVGVVEQGEWKYSESAKRKFGDELDAQF